VWQHPHPVPVMKGLRAIVHENADVKTARDIYEEEKQKA